MPMVVEVHDHQALQANSLIGRAEVPCWFYGCAGGKQEWLELKKLDEPTGRIHFSSSFVTAAPFVEAVVVVEPVPQ